MSRSVGVRSLRPHREDALYGILFPGYVGPPHPFHVEAAGNRPSRERNLGEERSSEDLAAMRRTWPRQCLDMDGRAPLRLTSGTILSSSLRETVHAFPDALLPATIGGFVVVALLEQVRQILLFDIGALVVVREAIADADAMVAHTPVGGVLEVTGHRL